MVVNQEKTFLGIEFGSTRIKAVLIDATFQTIASGGYDWENQRQDEIWTYSLESVWHGLQESYRQMAEEYQVKTKQPLTKIGGIGFSAMMHGYMAFDKNDQLLVPFRTWRNSITEVAAEKLTDLFHYNIPQRWSIAHLYQAILNEEKHVADVTFFTTLAGYVHWQLTDAKVLGIGDASGMFPIDPVTCDYDHKMLDRFSTVVSGKKYPWHIKELLPKVLVAGDTAGYLTEKGARLLDPTGALQAGIPLCPPEGDAGTGMTATNSVAQRTGNVSAGTSAFAMIVLEKPLAEVYPEIDLVTTPAGSLVAMVHTNNCTSEINAWVNLFREFADLTGHPISDKELFSTLFNQAQKGDADCGDLLSYGYYSGENITKLSEGRPLFVRTPDSHFDLANFMRMHLFSAFGAMKIGMDILNAEQVQVDSIVGHGGIFKTPEVAQKILAAVMEAPVTVMETAGVGGAWGIALLAAYMVNKETDEPLEHYLEHRVFADAKGVTLAPEKADITGFNKFMETYQQGLPIEQAAVDHFK